MVLDGAELERVLATERLLEGVGVLESVNKSCRKMLRREDCAAVDGTKGGEWVGSGSNSHVLGPVSSIGEEGTEWMKS